MPWPGVWSNFIAKSGGNEYHGKIYADYQNKGVQARNIDDSATFLCPGGRCGNLAAVGPEPTREAITTSTATSAAT